MKVLCNLFVLMLASFALASCGGGGSGSNSAFGGSPAFDISISASPASVTTNSFTTLTVTVKNPGGANAPDGTVVTASLSPATIGSVSGAPPATGGAASGTTATNTVTGGKTSFLFNSSNQTGTASITVTASSSSASININVTAGNSQDPRLQMSATSTTLPVNQLPQDPANGSCPGNFLGSPYISEVTLTFRHSNGELVMGTSTVNVSAAPTTIITFSVLNSGSSSSTNPCSDQFHTLLGSGPVSVTGGVGTIYVHSMAVPGTGTLSVTATDPDNGAAISSQLQITVSGGASGLPTSITAAAQGNAYISGSNGPQSTLVNAVVTDGSNAIVVDPSGYDNVEFTITGPAGSDARLSAVNAAGKTVTGSTVDTVTHNGIAGVTLLAGAQQGSVLVKATADRGDGNVDNGIQDAVSATATVVVSDGKLFSLKITNPAVDSNLLPVVGDATSSGSSTPTPVYTVPVTILAEDRQGAPVLAGTQIGFGLIDAPVFGFPDSGSGTFEISGNDGNPQEGGTLFTAPSGAFTTAGGGAGPGDALVIFGNQTTGDADLEGARTLRTINSAGSLNVTHNFNLNNTTGSSVNTGNNLQYVIGRATAGNIDANAFTGSDTDGRPNGIASVTMRYPQSRIGQSAVVWAQGSSTDVFTSTAKTVADAIRTRYLGIGPAVLTATPSTIFGNTTQTVAACLNDAAGSPIPGATISFSFSNLSSGNGTVNGKTSGALPPTGPAGCVDTTVVTSGIQPGSSANLVFTVSGLSATVTITVGSAVLTAVPNQITSLAGAKAENDFVTLTLKDGLGNSVSGATINGTCSSTAPGSVTVAPAAVTTDSFGTAQVTITSLGVCVASGSPGSGLCTFTYQQGSVTATAKVNVVGAVGGGPSPSPVCSN
jgi:hypothetical protein